MDRDQIRARSLETARQLGVYVIDWLPGLDLENMKLRDTDEVVSRILAMQAVLLVVFEFNRAEALAWLDREELIDALTGKEKQFLIAGEGDLTRFEVQVEGMWALSWAMGVIKKMDFNTGYEGYFVDVLPDIRGGESSIAFREEVRPRSFEEIVAALDLAYCLNWAVHDAFMRDREFPGNLHPYAVIERRRALEWVLGPDDWDHVPMDT